MKLSTRIKKYVPGYTNSPITLMVDCGKKETYVVNTLEEADKVHDYIIGKYTFLPQESPVISQNGITIHYASGTYADWCKA